MGLFASINYYLTDELLTQLAAASELPVAAARPLVAAAVPVLVQQLAQPTDFDELNARWAMCRQLYLSQLLTQPEELLRTDLGWPARRQLLAQKLFSTHQLASLAELTDQPAPASGVLGYLTVIALAVVGEQASKAGLVPTDMSIWLAEQSASSAWPLAATVEEALPAQQVAVPNMGAKLAVVLVLGGVAVAGLVGGYYWLGSAAQATQLPSAKTAKTLPAVAAPAAEVVAPAPMPAAAVTVATANAQPEVGGTRPKVPASVATAAVGQRDTAGSAALLRPARQKPQLSEESQPKKEDQSATIKLPNQTTLAVGSNSTEDILYKRLTNPDLLQPTDIAVDRLRFDLSQVRLAAEGAQQLGSIASILQAFPKVRLVVVGHANIRETQAIRLGLQRATLVVEELVKLGITADRLQAQGMLSTEALGKGDPVEKQVLAQGITLRISRL